MIAGERRDSARALFLEVVAAGGEWAYRAAPDGSGYQVGLDVPPGWDGDALMERVRRHKARLLGMVLVPDPDLAAVLQEARR